MLLHVKQVCQETLHYLVVFALFGRKYSHFDSFFFRRYVLRDVRNDCRSWNVQLAIC